MSMTQKNIVTEADIANFDNFDVPALKEAVRQVELSMLDAREVKSTLDKKTLALLPIYISFATLMLGLIDGKIGSLELNFTHAFWIPGSCFMLGAIFLLISLWSINYGSLGSYPILWLSADLIQGKNKYYGYTLAVILSRYQEKIEMSDRKNNQRAFWVNLGIVCGILAPISLIFSYFIF